MHWTNSFIGLPWRDGGRTREGVDCYGLVRLVYAEVLQVDLPEFAGVVCAHERGEVERLIDGQKPVWRRVDIGDAADFDIALIRMLGFESHVGVVCGRGKMLHIVNDQDACIVPLDWRGRVAGVYRHWARCE